MGHGCRLFNSVGTYFLGTVGQAVKKVSEPTSRALLGQGCRLLNQGWNLPPEHCWAGVQGV